MASPYRVTAGPYTIELPANGVAILYETDEGGTDHQLPGGVGYMEALVQFAGEVIRLQAIVAQMQNRRDQLLSEFKDNASKASHHHADDSCEEWHLAKPYEARCKAIFNEADDALKAEIRKIAGGYLISGWWRL